MQLVRRRLGLAVALALAALSGRALAHFPFIVPDKDGKATIVFSETLHPDPDVKIATLGDIKVQAKLADGSVASIETKTADNTLAVALPGQARVLFGKADLGVMQRGTSPAHVLLYYPKTLLGDPFDAGATLGETVPVEIIPVQVDGGFKLKLVAGGVPQAGKEIRLVLEDGEEQKLPTDADGLTERIVGTGRYGAWARHWIEQAGERDGKAYTQERHYATLVLNVEAAAAKAAASSLRAEPFIDLPEAVSSFGAAESDGWLYVYGGHTARRHDYSIQSVSGRFHRINLAQPEKWEALEGGPAIQGMNLASHGGKVYRVGGMMPRNAPGEEVDNVSIAEVARFDPSTLKWEALPPLPTPRSSHDVVIVDGVMYIVGGWSMKGRGQETVWVDTVDVLDLKAAEPKWTSIEQPFQRRALIAAVAAGKLYVMGGMNADDQIQSRVDVLDLKTRAWTRGPDVPGSSRDAFAPAACVDEGRVYLSVGSGDLFRLSEDSSAWQPVAKATPRYVHRVVAKDGVLFLLGGASRAEMLRQSERIALRE